jgi:hypothetical protein
MGRARSRKYHLLKVERFPFVKIQHQTGLEEARMAKFPICTHGDSVLLPCSTPYFSVLWIPRYTCTVHQRQPAFDFLGVVLMTKSCFDDNRGRNCCLCKSERTFDNRLEMISGKRGPPECQWPRANMTLQKWYISATSARVVGSCSASQQSKSILRGGKASNC